MKALWIEKELMIISASILLLERKMDIKVCRMRTFGQGLEEFQKENFDLVLMEPVFPGPQDGKYKEVHRDLVGLEFIDDIRKINPMIPVILASSLVFGIGEKDAEIHNKYQAKGCKFLEMPYSLEELEQTIVQATK